MIRIASGAVLFILVAYILYSYDAAYGPNLRTTAESPVVSASASTTGSIEAQVNWSDYAYVQYATDHDYLCVSTMSFEVLHRLGAKADLVMLYNEDWDYVNNPEPFESRMLIKARDDYGVKLIPVKVDHKVNAPGE